ncbi:MAG: DEAD/DEAH box helicase, partial [Nanoarchaeota archaeon]|nr:DEAD/DEAH box helicase [Nanoarchaeota archaeon]
MIKDFEPRLYQETILATTIEKNTLVVLPTGLGKTYIFLMLAAQRLAKCPDKKLLFLGPTRPLISQYRDVFIRHLDIAHDKLAIFTGSVSPEKRALLWEKSQIIFSTPQGLENDVISKKVKLEEVSLLGFDEAHRAVGNYSYSWIADQYMKLAKEPRILALTASPGSDLEKITEVCRNLHIEAVEVRTDNDPDVKEYIQEVKVHYIYVELPKMFIDIQKHLQTAIKQKTANLGAVVQVEKIPESRQDLLKLQRQLLVKVSSERDFEAMRGLSILAELMKLSHALELLESQGITPLCDFLENIIAQGKAGKTAAAKNLIQDLNFKSALILTRNLKELNI